MTIIDPTSLPALLGIAAGAGVLHTLAGPDHYLPIAAVSRSRQWSPRRTFAATALLGLLHCGVSVGIVVVSLTVFSFVAGGLLDTMSTIAAWLVIGTGLALALTARRRATATARTDNGALSLLALALMVGPCEVLLPIAIAGGGEHGLLAALQISGMYSACTIATMLAATCVATFGLAKLRRGAGSEIFAGGLCAASGVLMLVGF